MSVTAAASFCSCCFSSSLLFSGSSAPYPPCPLASSCSCWCCCCRIQEHVFQPRGSNSSAGSLDVCLGERTGLLHAAHLSAVPGRAAQLRCSGAGAADLLPDILCTQQLPAADPNEGCMQFFSLTAANGRVWVFSQSACGRCSQDNSSLPCCFMHMQLLQCYCRLLAHCQGRPEHGIAHPDCICAKEATERHAVVRQSTSPAWYSQRCIQHRLFYLLVYLFTLGLPGLGSASGCL